MKENLPPPLLSPAPEREKERDGGGEGGGEEGGEEGRGEEDRVRGLCGRVEGTVGEMVEGLEGIERAVGGWEFEEAGRLRDRVMGLKGVLEGDLERLGEEEEKGGGMGELVVRTIRNVEEALGAFERAKPEGYCG